MPIKEEGYMKLIKKFLMVLTVMLLASSESFAADFDWIRDFNIQAQADPSGFRARMGARFRIGDVEINAVLSNIEKPSDAYVIFRLGEISGRPVGYVMEQYKSDNGKAWGTLAKSLGIKPGSREFHSLKQGQDIYVVNSHRNAKGAAKNNGRGNGKANAKGKGRK